MTAEQVRRLLETVALAEAGVPVTGTDTAADAETGPHTAIGTSPRPRTNAT